MKKPKYHDFANILQPVIYDSKSEGKCVNIITHFSGSMEETTYRANAKELRELADYLDSLNKGLIDK